MRQDKVIRDGKTQHKTIFLAIARYISQTVLTALADIPVRNILSGELDRAVTCPPKTCDCLHQLILAIPGDPGNAQDLARPDIETDTADSLLPAILLDFEILDREHRLRRIGLAAIDGQQHAATHHQLRQIILIGLRWYA